MRSQLVSLIVSALIISATFAFPTVAAQELFLDINETPGPASPSARPTSFATTNGFTYFAADSGALGLGRELWRSDGTEAGTTLVADILPSLSSNPENITAMGDGTIVFTVGSSGQLWRSDGTAEGTTFIKQIAAFGSSDAQGFEAFEGLVYFFADDKINGDELWVTDGTESGTVMVADFVPGGGGHVGVLTATPNILYVAAGRSTHPTNGFNLYSSIDGPATPIFEGIGFPKPDPDDVFIAFGDKLFFELDSRPWISDGTPSGTFALHTTEMVGPAVAVGDVVYFAATQPGTGTEMWMSDGTPTGTKIAFDLNPGSADGLSLPTSIVATDAGTVVFGGVRPDVGAELFTIDGAQPLLLADVLPGPFGSMATPQTTFGDSVVFIASPVGVSREIYGMAATPGPFELLINPPDTGAMPTVITDVAINGGQLLMAAGIASETDLWRSDVTAAGTKIVSKITPPTTLGSFPSRIVSVGERGFFFAETSEFGRELYTTDGTPAGTQLVVDLNPGPASAVEGIDSFVALGDGIVFIADGFGLTVPFFSDGTAQGTLSLAGGHPDIDTSEITVLGDEAFFYHADNASGTQLWKTNGTPAGTQLVHDFTPGAAGVVPGPLVTIGDKIYTAPLVGLYGQELWVSDGTDAGTLLLADINPGPFSSKPSGMTAIGDRVVFAAKDPVAGREVWSTDGTPAGTTLTFDIRVPGDSSPTDFVVVDDTLVFNAKLTGGSSFLYSTDANLASVTPVFSWPTNDPEPAHRLGDGFAFVVVAATDGGLWVTDGTVNGTMIAVPKEVAVPFTILAQPGSDARLLFTGLVPGGSSARDLWVTDGTITGTVNLTDDILGTFDATSYSRLGAQAFVTEENGVYGTELFALPVVATGASVAEAFGTGCAGTNGVPSMITSGAPADGQLFTIGLENAAPSALTYLVVSTTAGTQPLGECALLPVPPLLVPMSTDTEGAASVSFTADASFIGLRLIVQWATFDAGGEFINKASLTSGLEIVFGP